MVNLNIFCKRFSVKHFKTFLQVVENTKTFYNIFADVLFLM